jgi:DNA repair protein RecN (Recombination protein N)
VLLEMRLRGLGVIADAVLELGPGLTVVTGETGAGKTMVVTGLGLLMGGRADPGSVREGNGTATVEGRVLVDPRGSAAQRAAEAGAELDDGDVLIVTRTVSTEGRGRTHLGGRSVPVGVLGEIAEHLVTVHGQSDQIRLRSASRQREALDRFAGPDMSEALATYRATWQRLRHVEGRLAEIVATARERQQEAELLRIGLAEVGRVQPQPGEDAALRAESTRLGHAEELRLAAQNAHLALTGDPDGPGTPDVAVLLAQARRALDQVAAHDPALAALAARLEEIGYLVADVAAECASYADGVEADPARLAAVEERRAALSALARTHGGDVDAVLAWAAEAAPRLLELDGDEDRTTELHAQREQLRAALAEHAAELTRRRADAAAVLGGAVSGELADLSMPDARLVVEVRRREDPDGLPVDLGDQEGHGAVRYAAGPDGIDEVEFLLAPHPGAPARPIARGASGGELSRVMLGLEVVLAAADPVPTFVFDEVDAGVGGRAALGIGRRLARLARTSQVLVVTHLAQVAAFADRHLTVVKSSDGEVTVSGVTSLDAPGRVRELARMLGGMADSGTAQAHAQELLEAAEQERSAVAERAAGSSGRRERAREPRTREGTAPTSRRSVRPSSGEDAPATAPTRS